MLADFVYLFLEFEFFKLNCYYYFFYNYYYYERGILEQQQKTIDPTV